MVGSSTNLDGVVGSSTNLDGVVGSSKASRKSTFFQTDTLRTCLDCKHEYRVSFHGAAFCQSTCVELASHFAETR